MSEQALPEPIEPIEAPRGMGECIRLGCSNRTTKPYCSMCDAMRRELSGGI